MYKFDQENHLKVSKGAVQLRGQIESIVDEITEKGFENLFLIGSGGSYAAMFPYDFVLKAYSNLPVYNEIAAELILTGNKHLGNGSVAVFSSLSGTTSETVAAVRYCKERGVTTIGLTGKADSPLAELVDHALINPAEDATAPESINIQLQILVYRIMNKRGEFPKYEELIEDLEKMPELLIEVRKQFDAKAEAFAIKHKDTNYHMLVGAGTLWGWVYNYSMCILEEMQWLQTTRVHSAEFFHGSLELIEEDTSIIIFNGEDTSRPLTDRVQNFVDQYTKNVFTLDTKEIELDGLHEDLRGEFSCLILSAMLERLNVYLERERNHPLTTRRYYRKVAY